MNLTERIFVLQIAVELSDRILVSPNRKLVQVIIGGTDDLDVVLEHEQSLCIINGLIVEWIDHFRDLLSKAQVFDVMRKVKSMLKILLDVMHMHVRTLEGTTWSNVKVACHLIDSELTVHSASLISLFLHLLHVAFANTLYKKARHLELLDSRLGLSVSNNQP